MCYRAHDLGRHRVKVVQQHTATTSSLRARFDERWAALMAWLRPSSKPTPVTATSVSQAKATEAAAKAMTRPVDQAATGAPNTSARIREREAETV